MSDTAETELIALVAQEQRGLRRILFAGFAALFAVVAMSVALGIYYFFAAQTLAADSARLERQAFDTRRSVDQQNNRVTAQEVAIRRAYDEIRLTSVGGSEAPSIDDALQAAKVYLLQGGHSLADERLIENAANTFSDGPQAALLHGVAALLVWERSGQQILPGAPVLPDQLLTAQDAFAEVTADPALQHLGHAGLAWIDFVDASSARSNFRLEDCESVIREVAASASSDQVDLQPLYWRAQCERKLGRTRDALRDYALALDQSRLIADGVRDEAEMTIEMNAFHGVGTVLIATSGEVEDAEMMAARQLANGTCEPDETATGSPRMALARACLDKAIALRRQLGQTDNQISGSGENIGFTYLRDGDFQGAFDHATAVERTGLFAWNETVRTVSALHLQQHAAAREARRNVSMFTVGQFNICELKTLLNPESYDQALAIIVQEHAPFVIDCK